MNQAAAFGILGVGGLAIASAVTGSSFGDLAKGKSAKVSTTGGTLNIPTVATAGAATGGVLGGVLNSGVSTGALPGPAGAQKVLAAAEAVVGGPYNQGDHSGAINQTAAEVKRVGTDCSGFISYLMGKSGLGIWNQAYATPGIPSAPHIAKGQGNYITIWNNPLPGNSGHVFIDVLGKWFQSAGGSTGIATISDQEAQSMIASGDAGAKYYPLHPVGY